MLSADSFLRDFGEHYELIRRHVYDSCRPPYLADFGFHTRSSS